MKTDRLPSLVFKLIGAVLLILAISLSYKSAVKDKNCTLCVDATVADIFVLDSTSEYTGEPITLYCPVYKFYIDGVEYSELGACNQYNFHRIEDKVRLNAIQTTHQVCMEYVL